MQIGLISDIHGNLVALDAVLADGVALGVDAWWVLGDLAAIGPEPIATLERLTNLPAVSFVRGNTDRYVVTGERPRPHAHEVERDPSLQTLFDAVEASFAWTSDAVASGGWIEWLRELPTEQRMTLSDGTSLLGVHASPGSDDGAGIAPGVPYDELAALLARADAGIVCGGHTHIPTDRYVGDIRAVNLGSVSNPVTSDLRASYVVIAADRHGHHVGHRRVAYDHEAFISRTYGSTHPEAEFIVSFQRGERISAPRP